MATVTLNGVSKEDLELVGKLADKGITAQQVADSIKKMSDVGSSASEIDYSEIKSKLSLNTDKSFNIIDNVTITITETNSTTIAQPKGFNASVDNFTYQTPIKDFPDSAYKVPDGVSLSRQRTVDFITNAPLFELRMVKYNTKFMVYVNGKKVQYNTFNTDSSGSRIFYKFDFGGDTSVKYVKIVGINMPFGGSYLEDNQSYFLKPNTIEKLKPYIYGLGDSYTFGAGTTNVTESWFDYFAKSLNFDYYFKDGVGGSGFSTAESRLSYLSNINEIPDYFVTALGYNDYDLEDNVFTDYVNTYIASLKTSLPNSKLIFVSPWTPSLGRSKAIDKGLILKNICDLEGIIYIDITDVMNSQNDVFFNVGDNTHPNDYGHELLGKTIASRLINI